MSSPQPPATPDRHPDDLPPFDADLPAGAPRGARRLPAGFVWAGVLAFVVLAVMLFVAGTGDDSRPASETIRLDNGATQPPEATGGSAGVGTALPSLVLTDLDGRPVALDDYRGAPLVVNFWASWCPPCLREMPDFEVVALERTGEIVFLGLNLRESAETARSLAERTGVTYDLALDSDGAAARAFGVMNMPTTAFVSAEGTVVEVHTGALDSQQLNARIDALLQP
jgi:thiol-disulfide isomerase/thioredoxin